MNRGKVVRPRARARALDVEILEHRTLLAVACEHGYEVLRLDGTAADDTIKVTAIRDSDDFVKKVVAKLNGKRARGCSISGVFRVIINAGDGNDNVTVQRFWSSYPDLDVWGGPGNDTLRSVKSAVFLGGEAGDDTLTGDLFDDYLYGGDGNDLLVGGAWQDILDGGEGDDTIYGGEGDDSIRGGHGSDLISGDLGNDTIEGSEGDDRLFGGPGTDKMDGGDGIDTMDGGPDLDIIYDQGSDNLGDSAVSGVSFLHGKRDLSAELSGEGWHASVAFFLTPCRLNPYGFGDYIGSLCVEVQVDVSGNYDSITNGDYEIALNGNHVGIITVRSGGGFFRASTHEFQLPESIESSQAGSSIRIGDLAEGVVH